MIIIIMIIIIFTECSFCARHFTLFYLIHMTTLQGRHYYYPFMKRGHMASHTVNDRVRLQSQRVRVHIQWH